MICVLHWTPLVYEYSELIFRPIRCNNHVSGLKNNYRLVRLANGAYSIHSVLEKETFHPVVGPCEEAEALYIRQLDLRARLSQCVGEFVIWDVGLGAGGNVLTVLRAIRDVPCSAQILSFDRTTEPLAFALQHPKELGYIEPHGEAVKELITQHRTLIREGQQTVRWELHCGDFPELLKAAATKRCWPAPNAILFDAFSPAKNPEMWTAELFSNLDRALDANTPCALATYSRSTMLRVTLLLAGFYVGVGDATGEKEETTIAANCLELLKTPLPAEWLQRARKSKSAEPLWSPAYRQEPISQETWERLVKHPQFNGPQSGGPL